MAFFNDKKKKEDEVEPAAPRPVATATAATPPVTAVPRYGIDDAIELMRKLPHDNVELVVRVVRATLESVKIHVYEIVRAAGERSQTIEAKINSEKARIGDLQKEIVTRQAEIEKLQKQFDETEMVKEKLLLADELDENSVKPAPAPAVKRPSPTAPPPTAGSHAVVELTNKKA